MSWCPAVSVEDFIRGLVSPSPQLMNSRKLPSAHADRCPATVAAGQWVVLMVSTISFLIHPCFWGRSIIFVQFVSGRSKMVVGQSPFNLCISKDQNTSCATLWWELVTVDVWLQMAHRSFHRPAGARSARPAAAQPSNWWEAELPPTLTCHPFSGPRKSAPISLHSAQYSTRTKVISIQISDSSVGVKDPFQLYKVVGYEILYEKDRENKYHELEI